MSNILSSAPSDIFVTIKKIYGNDVIYPACERAELLAQLAGTKTFTEAAIKTIKALGYTFIVCTQAPKVL